MWTIYAIGDTAFLQQILQGIVMLTGGGDYMVTARIATAIGALVVMFRSLRAGDLSIDFKELLIAFILYGLVFATPVTVAIESVSTGAVVTQAGVPVGFVASGSFLSLLGMKLTEQFETAFSTPSMLQHGFQASLETIKKVRIHTMSVSNFGAANAPVAGADVYSSWVNYISECTVPAIELRLTSVEVIMRNPSFVAALELNSNVNGTEIYIGGSPTNTDCANAFTQLRNFTATSFVPQFLTQIAPVLGGRAGSSAEAVTIISNALNGIGLGTTSVVDFVMTSALVPVFLDALAQSAESTYSASYATMIADAARNRAAQWMGQSSLFSMYVQPMMTFIEGFQYALMPLVMIMLLFGTGALPMLGKFLGGLLWIQLWYPLLAIVNLFEHMALTGSMSAMVGAGNGILSLAGTLQADQALLAWIGVGGMMASSVPMLAAGLAYGTWHGIDAMVGRMAGSETLRPDVAAPRDIGQQYSKVSLAPLSTIDPTLGLHQTGSERVDPAMTYSAVDSNRVESARSVAETATNDFRSRLARVVGNSFSVDERGGHSESAGQSWSASRTEALANSISGVASLAERISTSAQVDKNVAMGMAMEGALSAKPGMGMGASGSVSLTNREGVSESQRAAAERAISQAFAENPSLQSSMVASAAKDLRDNREHSVFASRSQGEQRALEESAARSLSATEAYQQAATKTVSGGATLTESAQAAVNAVRVAPRAREALTAAVARHGVGARAIALANQYGRQWRARYGGAGGAEIMGQLVALGAYDTSLNGQDSVLRRASFNEVMSLALGGARPLPSGAERNAGVAPGIVPSSTYLGGDIASEVTAELTSAAATVGRVTESTLRARHEADKDGQRERGAELAAPVADAFVKGNQIQGQRDRTPGAGEQTHGALERAGELLGGVSSMVGGAVSGAINGEGAGAGAVGALESRYGERIRHYREQGRSGGLTDAQAEYFGYAKGLGAFPGRSMMISEYADRVRAEAIGARMDPEQVLDRLDAAAQVADAGGATRRFQTLAETNRLHGLMPSGFMPGSAMDRATRRATGRGVAP
ncbi:IncF plasmid conjugative transfer protein TraG (plasmid) [Rhodovastum atsumiense]|nr:conjugal transfer protein TraG N-terminal domain-containing protein [Rhodovastum atsumiense]CAH2605786.1 IncF plasmid conjugative transfer protein TraG [Rhodovastum atsumiense]